MKLPAILGAMALALASCGSPADEGADVTAPAADVQGMSSAHLVLDKAPD